MLRRHLAGDVVLPADAGYDRARRLAHGEYDRIRPRAVVYAETDEDVRTAIRFAQDNDPHTVPHSGGHSLGGYSTTRGVVLDASRLNRIDVTRPARWSRARACSRSTGSDRWPPAGSPWSAV
jgi:FAD/FMN-containing dehydrogenase